MRAAEWPALLNLPLIAKFTSEVLVPTAVLEVRNATNGEVRNKTNKRYRKVRNKTNKRSKKVRNKTNKRYRKVRNKTNTL